MNFTLISPGQLEYNKIMMQKHLHQKTRKSKQNLLLLTEPSTLAYENKKVSEGLPRAGQSLLNNSMITKTAYEYECSPPRKQLNEENEKMKRLFKDELRETLVCQINRKNEENERNRKISKAMAVENGVLDYLEKEIEKRDNFIKECLVYQENCQSKFVDQDKLKTKRLETQASQNYNPTKFSIDAENYERNQKINIQKVSKFNNIEAENKRTMREYQRGEYVRYLEKGYVEDRHNPITNPMEYHVDNKYFKSKLENY